MRRFIFLIASLMMVMGPLMAVILTEGDLLATPRWNLQRASIATSVFLYPGDAYKTEFTADENGLAEVRVFMRPESLALPTDAYTLTLKDLVSGEAYGPVEITPMSLWDDVATLKIVPNDDSQDHRFRLTVFADPKNGSAVQLGRAVHDSDVLILQPYYANDISLKDTVTIVWERLSWRFFPLILLIPLLSVFLDRVDRLYRPTES